MIRRKRTSDKKLVGAHGFPTKLIRLIYATSNGSKSSAGMAFVPLKRETIRIDLTIKSPIKNTWLQVKTEAYV